MNVQFHKIINPTYQEAWDFQSLLHNDVKALKKAFLKENDYSKNTPNFLNHLVFCEHSHVLTLGKSASISNLIADKEQLKSEDIELYNINRGGDITYHGPGQLTGYLIFDLELLYRDVHKYVRNIEECIIQFLALYNINGIRLKKYTGVWIKDENDYRKICAIGVHLSKWVSMHGFGLNINTELKYFNNIIPCGIEDKNKSVTSLSKEIGRPIDMNTVYDQMKEIISEVFGFQYIN
ncbi:MAG: lipoyl(octanoyl) transferase LipB [Saprospiraceae bacterium]|nr:lipoyl(octanoyl) transferase LipB [Bacteroidia bacterium]NNE14967.1 lipoyl(octanoyl) transferase LipB [Saprospiraceae bacterium]NNL92195.1 lipoyl(octanoyl) transferase LipB [Saprospiraceae bacterium]